MIPTKTYPLSAIMGEEMTDKERIAELLQAAIVFKNYADDLYNKDPRSCAIINTPIQQRLWLAIDAAREGKRLKVIEAENARLKAAMDRYSEDEMLLIERCAKVCERQGKERGECPEMPEYCADAIRALKVERRSE